MATRLTKPLLIAIDVALSAALAGEFDGGDFEGMDREHFQRASDWAGEQLTKRGNANTADVSVQAGGMTASDWEREAHQSDAELAAVSEAIGSTRFMDPPDGGSPSLAEQVERMRRALELAERKTALRDFTTEQLEEELQWRRYHATNFEKE